MLPFLFVWASLTATLSTMTVHTLKYFFTYRFLHLDVQKEARVKEWLLMLKNCLSCPWKVFWVRGWAFSPARFSLSDFSSHLSAAVHGTASLPLFCTTASTVCELNTERGTRVSLDFFVNVLEMTCLSCAFDMMGQPSNVGGREMAHMIHLTWAFISSYLVEISKDEL